MTIDEVLKNTDVSNESVSQLKRERDEYRKKYLQYMLEEQASAKSDTRYENQ